MQSKTSLAIFRFLAGFVSVYHLTLGLLGTFGSTDFIVTVIGQVYGVIPTVDAQFIVLGKFISIYMFVFGIAMAILAWKPIEYRNLVWLPITLFTVRVVERLVFFDLLQTAFKLESAQNFQVILPIGILAVVLFYFRPQQRTS